MKININTEKIKSAFWDFYKATEIPLSLYLRDMSYISFDMPTIPYCAAIQSTQRGLNACRCSDQTMIEKCISSGTVSTHLCHAGLIDIAVPIIIGDTVIACITLGRMRGAEDFDRIKEYVASLSLPTNEMREYYYQTSYYDPDKVEIISRLAVILAKHLLLEDMLKVSSENRVDSVVKFIDDNFHKDLSVDAVSRATHLSSSTLYSMIRNNFGCTLSEYINAKRVRASVELLTGQTDLSIEEISIRVGFSSAAYYTKIFKHIMGTTPLKFRKHYQSNS
ncbi:MAG: PocR ligand-binding domain-containing protein [Clostridia bacterium]|nr:PocR ligand-binding domain-containing protein [Clostridia bacterium]MBQ9749040.1 PocR ligand-binding domain-containing protein [Clostridia bacterium]